VAAPDPTLVRPRPDALSSRNRRTALVLVAWIALLMLAAVVVAWLRN
jgi:hypothetical protein